MAKRKPVRPNDADRPALLVVLAQCSAALVMILAVVFSVPGRRKS